MATMGKATLRLLLPTLLGFAVPPMIPAPLAAQVDGEEIFRTRCAACHSLGGPGAADEADAGTDPRVGPSLAGVHDRRDRAWLVSQITAPDRMIAEGDSIAERLAAEYGMPMPNLGITPRQAESVLDYIAEAGSPSRGEGRAVAAGESAPGRGAESAAARGGAAAAGGEAPTEAQVDLGRALFQGTARLEGGGPSCNSCHEATHDGVLGGGSLARDLTAAHSRLGGAGTRSILQSLPFPVMQRAYAGRPLTEREVAGLVAFLERVDAERAEHEPRRWGFLLFGAGFLGTGLLLGAVSTAWRGRRRGSVNQEIFDRQIESR